MKKKILSAILVLTMLCSLIVVPTNVSAGYYGYMPLNIRTYIDRSSGTPKLKIDVLNKTSETVVYFETTANFFDAYGNILRGYDGNTEKYYKAEFTIKPYDQWRGDSYLYEYPRATSCAVTLTKVRFEDGSTWTNPGQGSLYTEANATVLNRFTINGTCIVDETREVYLCENGYSTFQRDWYVWSDSVRDWVWFSNEINPAYPVYTSGASFKLVINNNQNMYKLLNVNVTQLPNFNLKYRNSTKVLSTSTSNADIFYTGYYDTAPYAIDLWDVNEHYGTRTWYWINIDTGAVYPFSNDRGPTCYLPSKGNYAIALEYDNDPSVSVLYAFAIR